MALLGVNNASVYPYQSLIAIERIGMSEQAFSLLLAALIFAVGMALGGFETVALIGLVVALSGASCLYLADRHHWFAART